MSRLRGSIAATFKVGEEAVGQVRFEAEKPRLELRARPFLVIEEHYNVVSFAKPRLLLQARAVGYNADVAGRMRKPQLLLRARSFRFRNDHYAPIQKARLLLVARETEGRVPGIVPSPEVPLVPSIPVVVDEVLVPSIPVEDPWIIKPTEEAFV